ncbi:CheY-like chemotaxis protein [Rhodoblastus acidophilus]|uniref:hypothetical protein n=1 Tax=Rhodoblastus acidophilus TaxID=1074 RepID=UPI0022256BB1|nr:hypothetical protein [Rhodoblastus acidophilus]MCW2286186.1 CheY-like chemotaxis protein [Rhodoblastus acidophilus]MCW2335080.1 CheY-like chemotaxis protein [Rhodoblastus acidophilus]
MQSKERIAQGTGALHESSGKDTKPSARLPAKRERQQYFPSGAIMGSSLQQRRVFLVAGDFMLNQALCYALENEGAEVVGHPRSVKAALDFLAAKPIIDAAYVDADLTGRDFLSVAEALHARGIPFVFATFEELEALRERFPKSGICHMPYDLMSLRDGLLAAVEREGEKSFSASGRA